MHNSTNEESARGLGTEGEHEASEVVPVVADVDSGAAAFGHPCGRHIRGAHQVGVAVQMAVTRGGVHPHLPAATPRARAASLRNLHGYGTPHG